MGIIKILDEDLMVFEGSVNVTIFAKKKHALLINCGEGSVINHLQKVNVDAVEKIAFTDYYRDKSCGLQKFIENGSKVIIPHNTMDYFVNPEEYWLDGEARYHKYNYYNRRYIPRVPIREMFIEKEVKAGDIIYWEDFELFVISTPGPEDEAVSYMFEKNGKKYCVVGDLLRGDGQLSNVYYLQKGYCGLMDYHGFCGSVYQLRESLNRIKEQNPDVLIPSQGKIIYEPENVLDNLDNRLKKLQDNYLSISSVRYWFKDIFKQYELPDYTQSAKSKSLPDWVVEMENTTSKGVLSECGDLFLIDCGVKGVIDILEMMMTKGQIKDVSAIWVTHYHDDHVDFINMAKEDFNCQVFAVDVIKDVLENPRKYDLPCLSTEEIKVEHPISHGVTFLWKEFKMTAYHFPGQAYYHGGLLVEKKGTKVFFAGDSLTIMGIDDYCAFNGNPIGKGVGYDFCLKLLKEIEPDILVNQHAKGGFVFSNSDIDYMINVLKDRETIYNELLPYKDVNRGIDPNWVNVYPYEQLIDVNDGEAHIKVIIHNRGQGPERFNVKLLLTCFYDKVVDTKTISVGPQQKGELDFAIKTNELHEKKCVIFGVCVECADGYFSEVAAGILKSI